MAMIFSSPKNFKRGRLINNRYRPVDLMIGIGAVIITLGLEGSSSTLVGNRNDE